MAGEFFDYDPLTGLTEYYEETSDGQIHIHTVQDVEPFLDMTKRLANEGTPDEAWKKRGATLYAFLPPIIVGQLLKKGVNVFDQNDVPRLIKEINTNYTHFKTTHKHHEVKPR